MKQHNSLILYVLVLLYSFAHGHSGKIAFSYPLNNIQIDGNLSDWPKSIEKYKITHFFGNPSNSTAFFQTGYDFENRILFVAITVQDDQNISSNRANDIFNNSEDKLILYLDPEHSSTKGSGVLTIGVSQSGFKLKKVRSVWDVYNSSFDKSAISFNVRHANGTTVYEGAIQLKSAITANRSLGLDFLIYDYDKNNTSAQNIAWSKGGAKAYIPSRLGDLILLPLKEKTGNIKGMVRWHQETKENLPKSYLVQSKKERNLWTIINIDSLGQYGSILPVGNYNIRPWQKTTNAFSFEDKSRINEFSSVDFAVVGKESFVNDTLKLKKYNHPKFLIPSKGVFFSEKFNLSQIDNFIMTYKEYCNVIGLSLAVIKDGNIVYNKHFGYENTITQKPISSTSVFEIASVSKTVFAFAVNRLAEKKLIDLDQPLFTYLPFPQLKDDHRFKKITARHILSHQSGLPNWAWGGPFGSKNGGKIELSFDPGTEYQYSGEGYEYLKRVIEKITKKSILSIIKEEVYLPLGMTESSFVASSNIENNIVVGHTENIPMFWNLHDQPWVSGSMYSSSKDMAIFMQALMEKKGLSLNTYLEMFKPQIENTDPWIHYFGGSKQFHSMGFEVEDTPFARIIHHGGNNGDFQARFAMDWQAKNGFILLTNNNNGFALDLALQEFFFSGRLN